VKARLRQWWPGKRKHGGNASAPSDCCQADSVGLSRLARLNELATYRAVLLLQGPNGPFFARLAARLERAGVRVWKINFNLADRVFYLSRRATEFRQPFPAWRPYLEHRLEEFRIEAIVLFGNNRAYHRVAREVAASRGVDIWVFEEGYVRPGFVTLEKGGVNGDSPLMHIAAVDLPPRPRPPVPVRFRFPFARMVALSAAYTFLLWVGKRRFPHYVHHRPYGLADALRWASGLMIRKPWFQWSEHRDRVRYLGSRRPYFLFVMQMECDPAVQVYSRYRTNCACLGEVIHSFAQHAAPDVDLVVRPHPMERGHASYGPLVASLAKRYGVQARVRLLHEGHMPTLLKRSLGVVTINSTVGVQTLFHRVPIKTLGTCFYDKPGLTDQQPLHHFWKQPKAPDPVLSARFYRYLIAASQLNSSFYADTDVHPGAQPRAATRPQSVVRGVPSREGRVLPGQRISG
jgi:capsular polysaccharide export protein